MDTPFERFLDLALINTDERVAADLPVTLAFLYAALLWGVVGKRSRDFASESNLPPQDTLLPAMNEAIDNQIKTIAIPRRFTADVRESGCCRTDLMPLRASGPNASLPSGGRFRAAFDFRAAAAASMAASRGAGEVVGRLSGCQWRCKRRAGHSQPAS